VAPIFGLQLANRCNHGASSLASIRKILVGRCCGLTHFMLLTVFALSPSLPITKECFRRVNLKVSKQFPKTVLMLLTSPEMAQLSYNRTTWWVRQVKEVRYLVGKHSRNPYQWFSIDGIPIRIAPTASAP
jgi:hypothetical protein